MKNNNSETIKFSILIPVYNVEEYLHECLDSVLSQNYTNFEVIITNDGSTDKSSKICDEYASVDDRIFVHHQENKGLLMARRNSIEHSTGNYYLFLDSDDTWKPNTLETVYKTIIETEPDMVVFNWDRMIENKFISSEPVFEDQKTFSGDAKKDVIEKFVTTNKLNSLCLKVVKSSIIDKKNDYSYAYGLTMGEDALQTIPLLMNSDKIVYIQNPLYNYRINEESSTSSFNPKHIRDINIVNEAKINFLYKINNQELLKALSKRYINTIAKQIMNASVSDLSVKEKIDYLKNLQSSHCYMLMAEYIDISEFILPVKVLIKNLNKQNFEKVIQQGRIFNFFWNNSGRLQARVKSKV